jgi:hypothetical protein
MHREKHVLSLLFVIAAIAAAFLLTTSSQLRADQAYILTSPPTTTRNNSYAFGQVFTPVQDFTVTALGAFDDQGDGFQTSGGIPVGIFRQSDHALLASTTVTDSGTLSSDDFRFANISPIALQAGIQYQVQAVNESDVYLLAGIFGFGTYDNSSLFTDQGYQYSADTTLDPNNTLVVSSSGHLWMANFLISVPEPSTVVLAGLGLVSVGLVALRKKYRRA